MNTNSFYHTKLTKKFIKENNLKFSRGWTSDDDSAYIAFYPIHKYHNLTTLELRVVVWESGETRIDVIDAASRGVYAPWYRNESYDRYPILKEINGNIHKIMTSLGFKYKEKKYAEKSNHD